MVELSFLVIVDLGVVVDCLVSERNCSTEDLIEGVFVSGGQRINLSFCVLKLIASHFAQSDR